MANDLHMVQERPPAQVAPVGLRVLAVGMGWFPDHPGGLNRVFYHLARELPGQGVAVEALVQEMAAPAAGQGWSATAMAPRGASFLTRLRRQRTAIAAAIDGRPHDLVAAHFAPSLWPFPSLHGAPLVVHFHGPWALESHQEGASRARVLAAWCIERDVYRRATRFIVLSQAFADVLARHYRVPADRIRLVPGGVDTDRFSPVPSRQTARASLGLPADRPIIVCVRRLVRRMGIENLLEAMVLVRDRCPDALLVVGGQGALREALEQRARVLSLERQVRFAGRVPDADLPLLYRAADVSVVPTVALEGFGLVVTESLAAGTPVLATPVGGIPDVLRPLDPDLICESPAPRHLAERLVAAVTGAMRLPDAESCATYARREFAWSSVARRVRDVYAEAAHGQS